MSGHEADQPTAEENVNAIRLRVSADEATLAILQDDPAWAWLRDPAEDIYTEDDVRLASDA